MTATHLAICHVGRQSSGAANLQTLNNRCFAAAIVSHNDGEGLQEFDRLRLERRERPNPLDRHLADFGHGWIILCRSFSSPPLPSITSYCSHMQRFATNRTEDRVALPSLLSQSLFRGGTHPMDHGIIEGSHLVIKRVDCKAVGVNGRDELDRANQIHQHVPVATPHICRHSLTPSPVPSDCGTC